MDGVFFLWLKQFERKDSPSSSAATPPAFTRTVVQVSAIHHPYIALHYEKSRNKLETKINTLEQHFLKKLPSQVIPYENKT
ncbi:hypothetical protein ATANTOWER_022922 [Ataeniobius toweri]|uniref:Uncharacterized protein n=1 Tax=Ataeniobius toweri TaxID=208326 RepID=A0ABU7CEJ1_9TELE|nr:hypothetical protein [Ataeniobius toweri]